MNNEVLEFYSKSSIEDPTHPLFEVIFIEQEESDFDNLKEICPDLPKGWFELARLDLEDRKEFIRTFWEQQFPFFSIEYFFNMVEDIGVFLTKQSPDTPFIPEIVYSFEENNGFIRAFPPLTDRQVDKLSLEFDYLLPKSYLQFLKIHRQIIHKKGKLIDPFDLKHMMQQFQRKHANSTLYFHEKEAHLFDLIPFFIQKDPKGYQCFVTEWQGASEILNVFFEEHKESGLSQTNMFDKFLDWLQSLLID